MAKNIENLALQVGGQHYCITRHTIMYVITRFIEREHQYYIFTRPVSLEYRIEFSLRDKRPYLTRHHQDKLYEKINVSLRAATRLVSCSQLYV